MNFHIDEIVISKAYFFYVLWITLSIYRDIMKYQSLFQYLTHHLLYPKE